MPRYILAIDQGTTSSRAVVFDQDAHPVSQHQIEIKQYYPHNSWVAHDPNEIWQTTLTCCQQALKKAHLSANEITALGISNQRETTALWHRHTGKIIQQAIVWQDRRTTEICEQLRAQQGVSQMLTKKTGLLLDPYFPSTKIKWLLDNIPGVRKDAAQGNIAFGTIDSFLLWKLTNGKVHATDITNASRTMLFNIHTLQSDDELLALFDIPKSLLPEVHENCAQFGETAANLLGKAIPITAMIGDQQAAMIGQACFQPGMVKSTYGTGCFLLLHTGEKIISSKNKLLSTIAYRVDGKIAYGLEGSIFAAGAIIKWLRDKLHLIKSSAQTQELAASVADTGGVHLIPAFTGLAVCYQTVDLIEAMRSDGCTAFASLRVDGGMAANNWLLQFLADLLAVEVSRPRYIETTALGAAYMAGLGAGLYQSLQEISTLWEIEQTFTPQMPQQQRTILYKNWQEALERVLTN